MVQHGGTMGLERYLCPGEKAPCGNRPGESRQAAGVWNLETLEARRIFGVGRGNYHFSCSS